MLQVYSIEERHFHPIAAAPSPETLKAARWIDLHDPTPDEARLVEEALGIDLQIPDETDRTHITDQVRASGEQLTLKALMLTGVASRKATLVPVTVA